MTDRLARLREMQREYEAQVDPPAWLSLERMGAK